jgi:hypothetical protein
MCQRYWIAMSCNEPVFVTDRQVAPNVGQNQTEHQSISIRSTNLTVYHATILHAHGIVKHPLVGMCWWAHHFVFGCLDGTDTMCPPSWCSVKAPPEDSCCARQRSSSLWSLPRRLLLLAGGSTQAVSAPPYGGARPGVPRLRDCEWTVHRHPASCKQLGNAALYYCRWIAVYRSLLYVWARGGKGKWNPVILAASLPLVCVLYCRPFRPF